MSEQEDSTAADLEQAILNDATDGIASVTVDGETVVAMSPKDRLHVLERQTTATAATQPHFGLRITQLVPPGCG